MNETNLIEIEVNAVNPVEYLACLGIFEIASRFDQMALARWKIAGGKSVFIIESESLSDRKLLEIIVPTLSNLSKWEAVYSDGKRRKLSDQVRNKDDKLVQLEVILSDKTNQENKIIFDWWYEIIKEDGKTSSSKWKMYAAQQNPEQLSEEFANEAVKLLKNLEVKSLTDLLKITIKSQSKFGFDPRPCVNALDLGFVPNDLSAKDKGFPTYLFAEMLSVFGAQFFFPARTAKPKETKSTRSWQETRNKNRKEDNFLYRLWFEKCPISLARVIASDGQASMFKSMTFNSLKDRRGEYLGNLKFAILANLTKKEGENYE